MTIEQLEQANEIYEKINIIQRFQDEQNKNCMLSWKIVVGVYTFDLYDFVDLKVMIQNYTSNKIAELEKQLEEL